MIPRILVKVGRGYDPVELQQLIDTDLQTRNKTVVGAINELLEMVEELGETGTTVSASVYNAETHYDFPSIGDESVIYKAQSEQLLYQWNSVDLTYEVLGEIAGEIGAIDVIHGGNAS